MTRSKQHRFSLDDLEELYGRLASRLDRLEGNVRQLLAERTRDTLSRPTWRDFDELQKEVDRSKPSS